MRTKSEKLYDEADELARWTAELAKELDPYEFYESAMASGCDPGDAVMHWIIEARMALLSGRKHELMAYFAGYEPSEVAERFGWDTSKEFRAMLKALERFRRGRWHDDGSGKARREGRQNRDGRGPLP